MSPSIQRVRGCCIGGALHGQDLPAEIRAPRLVLTADPADGRDVDEIYLHQRLEDDTRGESVECLVLEGLDPGQAFALVEAERERRGGWGEPLVTLPAAGFRFEYERQVSRDPAGNFTGLAGWGLVKRFSPEGVLVAATPYDTSRALSRDELDEDRCPYCATVIGHTLDLHRQELEQHHAEERAAAFKVQPQEARPHPLHLAVLRALSVDEDELYLNERHQARQVEQAHQAFIARRQAEAAAQAPQLILPAGVR